MLRRLRGSRAIRNGVDTQDTLSFESCWTLMACNMEEVSSESSRKMQEKEETMSEASWTANAPSEGGEETQSPKRKVIRVESEETQD